MGKKKQSKTVDVPKYLEPPKTPQDDQNDLNYDPQTQVMDEFEDDLNFLLKDEFELKGVSNFVLEDEFTKLNIKEKKQPPNRKGKKVDQYAIVKKMRKEILDFDIDLSSSDDDEGVDGKEDIGVIQQYKSSYIDGDPALSMKRELGLSDTESEASSNEGALPNNLLDDYEISDEEENMQVILEDEVLENEEFFRSKPPLTRDEFDQLDNETSSTKKRRPRYKKRSDKQQVRQSEAHEGISSYQRDSLMNKRAVKDFKQQAGKSEIQPSKNKSSNKQRSHALKESNSNDNFKSRSEALERHDRPSKSKQSTKKKGKTTSEESNRKEKLSSDDKLNELKQAIEKRMKTFKDDEEKKSNGTKNHTAMNDEESTKKQHKKSHNENGQKNKDKFESKKEVQTTNEMRTVTKDQKKQTSEKPSTSKHNKKPKRSTRKKQGDKNQANPSQQITNGNSTLQITQ